MNRSGGALMIVVIVLAVLAMAVGAVFVVIGAVNYGDLRTELRQEEVTLGLTAEEVKAGEVVDTMAEARRAADKLAEDRRSIAPTYSDLLAGAHFNPSILKQLTYAQALNLENSMLIAVLGFGVAYEAIGVGAGLILVGIALAIIAAWLAVSQRKAAATVQP